MARRSIEPEEAIEPVIDGLEETDFLSTGPALLQESETLPLELATMEEPGPDGEEMPEPELLVFGQDDDAAALMALADPCGFNIHIVGQSGGEAENPLEDKTSSLEDFQNIVADCDIGRDTFVCVFLDDEVECELVLSQCLASDACYIGVAGSHEKLAGIFNALKADGAPDAELAAIAAPMGLNIGAKTPEQRAIAIMAEMLAAKAGKLKKLRYGRGKGWKVEKGSYGKA